MPPRSHKRNNSSTGAVAANSPRPNNTNNNSVKQTNIEKIRDIYGKNEIRYKNQRYPATLYDKWTYDKVMSEIVLQSYLIYSEYRNVAEIKIKHGRDKQFMNVILRELEILFKYKSYDVEKELKINDMLYEIQKDSTKENVYYLYLYLYKNSPKMEKNNIDKRGEVIAVKLDEGKLGAFYTCKTASHEWKTYEWRILIHCDGSEIFAQMCKPEDIAINMGNTMQIYETILILFQQLDTKRFTQPKNPLQINIYKTKVDE